MKKPKRKSGAYIKKNLLRPESLMMSYGYNPHLSEGAAKAPIFQTSTFVFKSAEDGARFFRAAHSEYSDKPLKSAGLIYSRLNNPNLEILEDRLTLWDDAEAAVVFESGMAAVTTTLFEFLNPGDAVLHSEPLYGGSDFLIKETLGRFGIKSVGFRAGADVSEIEKNIHDAGFEKNIAMVFIETPANPTNELVDIKMCARIAKRYSTRERKVIYCVDNTFLGPLWQKPFELGADLVLYSATKYIGGHSDLVAGAVLGSQELIFRLKSLRATFGNMAGPWTSWLMMRSLETLKVRMTAQTENACHIADFLSGHHKVGQIYYLGHISKKSSQYKIYQSQCLAPGAMISFDIKGGKKEAFRFLNSLKLIKLAVSLGGTESLAEHPASMTHSGIVPKERVRMGITDNMVRLSVGVEHYEDIISDIKQALARI